MYQERKVKPRRPDAPFRIALVAVQAIRLEGSTVCYPAPDIGSMAASRLSPVVATEVAPKATTDTD